MEKYEIPENNSLDSMEGLETNIDNIESVRKSPSAEEQEALKDDIINALKNNEVLSDETMLAYFKLHDVHARIISNRVCQHMEISGVSDIFDINFWKSFFEAERKVLEEEQGKEVEVVEVVDLDEKLEIRFTRDRVQNMEEVYETISNTVIIKGIRGKSSYFSECCDHRPRISKVLTHFLFNSLITNGFVKKEDKEDFLKLFIPTTQAGGRFVKKNNKQPYESISNETLRKEKLVNSRLFFGKYSPEEKEELLKHIKAWQMLCINQRNASQDILRIGIDKVKESLDNEDYTLGCSAIFPWMDQYNFIVTEDQFLKGAENMADTIRKHKEQKAGDIIGHSLAYALRVIEALEMV